MIAPGRFMSLGDLITPTFQPLRKRANRDISFPYLQSHSWDQRQVPWVVLEQEQELGLGLQQAWRLSWGLAS